MDVCRQIDRELFCGGWYAHVGYSILIAREREHSCVVNEQVDRSKSSKG